MGTTILFRHECDRCHAITEAFDDIRKPSEPPDGWMLVAVASQKRLMCDQCLDGLRRFMAENAKLEQSR